MNPTTNTPAEPEPIYWTGSYWVGRNGKHTTKRFDTKEEAQQYMDRLKPHSRYETHFCISPWYSNGDGTVYTPIYRSTTGLISKAITAKR